MASSLCNTPVALAFVTRFKAGAAVIAQQLQVPVENILGLAAEQTQYGSGRIAKEYQQLLFDARPSTVAGWRGSSAGQQ